MTDPYGRSLECSSLRRHETERADDEERERERKADNNAESAPRAAEEKKSFVYSTNYEEVLRGAEMRRGAELWG